MTYGKSPCAGTLEHWRLSRQYQYNTVSASRSGIFCVPLASPIAYPCTVRQCLGTNLRPSPGTTTAGHGRSLICLPFRKYPCHGARPRTTFSGRLKSTIVTYRTALNKCMKNMTVGPIVRLYARRFCPIIRSIGCVCAGAAKVNTNVL